MKEASTADLVLSYQNVGTDGWTPVIDGNVFPDIPSIVYAQGNFSKIPFMSGDVLDEGSPLIVFSFHHLDHFFTGTHFVQQVPGLDYSSQFIKSTITKLCSPPLAGVTTTELSESIDELLTLYPDDPALGSPYNTGNETFGLDGSWKRATSISTLFCLSRNNISLILRGAGDLLFQSTRRMWLQAAASHGSKVYGYLLTQPQLGDPSLGGVPAPALDPHNLNNLNTCSVDHTATKKFFYGDILTDGVASDAALSFVMMDYWISFANCLDPNDGKGGTARPKWGQYTTSDNAIMQLNGNETVMIKDDFRSQGINAINTKPLVFYH
jgi:carboxylesterase type B